MVPPLTDLVGVTTAGGWRAHIPVRDVVTNSPRKVGGGVTPAPPELSEAELAAMAAAEVEQKLRADFAEAMAAGATKAAEAAACYKAALALDQAAVKAECALFPPL